MEEFLFLKMGKFQEKRKKKILAQKKEKEFFLKNPTKKV